MREQRQLAASVTLILLALGSLIPLNEDQSSSFSEFHVDHITREIYRENEQPWFRLNISEVVADKLSGNTLLVHGQWTFCFLTQKSKAL